MPLSLKIFAPPVIGSNNRKPTRTATFEAIVAFIDMKEEFVLQYIAPPAAKGARAGALLVEPLSALLRANVQFVNERLSLL